MAEMRIDVLKDRVAELEAILRVVRFSNGWRYLSRETKELIDVALANSAKET